MTRHVTFLCTSFLMLIWVALPTHATTTCSYDFTAGSGNKYLSYCVTANGNILEIVTPFGKSMLGNNGEGYGICNESPAQNYTDYGVSATGNWGSATVLSQSASSIKIQRSTADGNWTLTQTITKVPATSSIKVVMALTNNQSTAQRAYLVRFADAEPVFTPGWSNVFVGGLTSALVRTNQPDPNYGLQLSNAGAIPFDYWQGFVQSVNTGPNACAFAFNEANNTGGSVPNNFWWNGPASIEMAYVGTVGAGLTKTVTLSYHGL